MFNMSLRNIRMYRFFRGLSGYFDAEKMHHLALSILRYIPACCF